MFLRLESIGLFILHILCFRKARNVGKKVEGWDHSVRSQFGIECRWLRGLWV